MNQKFTRIFQVNDSGIGCFLTFILISLLLGSVGLGWVVNGFLILVAFLLISPAIAFLGIRWWLKRNLVEDKCPVCDYEFTGFKEGQYRCPSCGEMLKVENGKFQRTAPPGTIDVEVVEVTPKQLED